MTSVPPRTYEAPDLFSTIRPVDERTQSLLELVHGDRIHTDDRERVVAAIIASAEAAGGVVDPNDLRGRLYDDRGECLVYPAVIGTTVNGLRGRGALVHIGWTVTTGSFSGNNGRPARVYRLMSSTSTGGAA